MVRSTIAPKTAVPSAPRSIATGSGIDATLTDSVVM
jgi:hypothetical protein